MILLHGTHSLISVLALPLLLAGVQQFAAADDTTAASGKPGRILFVTQSFGYKHSVVDRKSHPLSMAEQEVTDWGASSNLYHVDCTQDVAKDLTKDNLQNYDIVMFYTTGPRAKWPVDDATLDYLCTDWVKQRGHGFIGVHAGADTLEDYQPYWEMLGGTFNGHPWNANEKVTVTVHDQNHPLSKPWGPEFEITDEIYRFKNWQPEKVRVLMSLNMAKTRLKQPYQVPIAWVKNYGDGKVLHMSLGHREDVWTNEKYTQSLLGGVKWLMGLEPGDATPNPDVSSAQEAKAKDDFEAAQK